MLFRTIFPVIIGSIISFFNFLIRALFPQINSELRYLDHLIAGVGVTILIYCSARIIYDVFFWRVIRLIKVRKVKEILHSNVAIILLSCTLSIYAAFYWEFYQFRQRGYIQYVQLMVDCIGVLIFFIVFNKYSHMFINNSTMNRNMY